MSCCWKELNEQKIKFSPQISQIQFYKFTMILISLIMDLGLFFKTGCMFKKH